MKEVFTNTGSPLLYIGSVSPLERVYLDPSNQVYYIKYLASWDNSIYTTSYEEKEVTNISTLPIYPYVDPEFNITNIHNLLPIFPAYDSFFSKYGIPFIYYTNSQRDRFSGIDPVAPMSKEN